MIEYHVGIKKKSKCLKFRVSQKQILPMKQNIGIACIDLLHTHNLPDQSWKVASK